MELPYASVWQRIVAQGLDLLILIFPLYAVTVFREELKREQEEAWLLSRINNGEWPGGVIVTADEPTALLLITSILTILIPVLYSVGQEAVWGQTLGKRAVGIRVVKDDGQTPIGFREAGIRYLLLLLAPVGLYVVSTFMISRSSKNQRFGDQVAGTVVIRA